MAKNPGHLVGVLAFHGDPAKAIDCPGPCAYLPGSGAAPKDTDREGALS